MANTSVPSVHQLSRAIKIAEQIQELKAEMANVLGNAAEPQAKRKYSKKPLPAARSAPAVSGKKRVLSPEAREKIAAAQRARWAKQLKKGKKG